ncbi:hypothetical protein C0Q70_09776 [Pomacea canaliculata]|uniref:SH2 domain-containing protein n=1 Tax=Pomacea canaliculata TaxID=400727 RepID=A0A2T7PAR9_POMCA|nr:hypothetical protein C0Q70_09776 [Pomacea canaliculata]
MVRNEDRVLITGSSYNIKAVEKGAQVYVVISGGCVYCYSNEVAKKPASAFSLYGYNRVFRAGEVTSKEATWVFKITHVSPEFRTYMFSCSSEREMKHWMKFFKQEMLRANGKLARTQGDGICADQDSRSDSSVNSQDYIDIETNIYEDSKTYIAPSRDLNKREDEESDEEMDNVIKRCLRDPRDRPPLPPPVPDRTTKMARDKNNAPSSAVGKKNLNQIEDVTEFWETIYYRGDKELASQIIRNIHDEGVYLVRVNSDGSMVLHVYGEGQARKYQIIYQDKEYTLQRTSGNWFKTVPELVYFYYTNTLPNIPVCLTECYAHHSSYLKS